MLKRIKRWIRQKIRQKIVEYIVDVLKEAVGDEEGGGWTWSICDECKKGEGKRQVWQHKPH